MNTYACFPENSLVGFRSGTHLYEKLLKHELTEVSGACILCILDSKGDNTWMITFVNIPWWEVVTVNVSVALVLHVIVKC